MSKPRKVVVVYTTDSLWKEKHIQDAKNRFPAASRIVVVTNEAEFKKAMRAHKGNIESVNYGGTFIDEAQVQKYARPATPTPQ